jgi:glycerol-3-phosphate dehydrogenase (NAD(P)+)
MGRVAVFSAGSWGTAFGLVLADAGNDVTLWARRDEVVANVNDKHENPDYFPGVELPARIRATTEPAEALDGAEFVVMSVPSQTLRDNLAEWAPLLPTDAVLISPRTTASTCSAIGASTPVLRASCSKEEQDLAPSATCFVVA